MKARWLLSTALAGAIFGCHHGIPGEEVDTRLGAPPHSSGERPRAPSTAQKIDALLSTEWAKAGLVPTSRVDDARFVRRVYLDVVGTIPPPLVVTTFVADRASDKRARLVDQLLASPTYAAYWATLWEDTLVGWQTKDQAVDRGALRAWLEGQFTANASWDAIVTGLITAEGRNSLGGKPEGVVPEPVSTMAASGFGAANVAGNPTLVAESTPVDETVNGAVNWIIKYRETPADLAGNASRLFLGVQIQCAQCHDHKTEKWTQDDFRRFAACFVRTRSEVVDKGNTMGEKRVDVVDIGRPLPRYAKDPDVLPLTQAEPRALDGLDLGASPNTRKALAAWMTAKENPWFDKAIVNRMWGHFLGRGFVDPVDDLRPSNPPAAPQLFDLVSEDFVAQGRDLRALIRTITATEAYQLTPLPKTASATQTTSTTTSVPPAPPFASGEAGRLWSRFHLTPLGPNELLRSLLDATGVEAIFAQNARANLERIRLQLYQRYSFLFDVDESFDAVAFEGTVAQALTLLNGAEVGGGTSAVPGGALDAVLQQPGSDADKVAALYRRTLARAPSDIELAYWTRYVSEPHAIDPTMDAVPRLPPPPRARKGPKKNGKGGKPGKENKPPGPDAFTRLELRDDAMRPDPRRQAFEDLFWALLNSSEFTFNH